MPRPVSWLDRLRIERLVWSLDQYLYDLPRASRIATRREVRQNVLAAAHDVGAAEAIRRVGSSRRLADDYLSAELGDEPRPSWLAAALFLFTGQLLLTSLLTDAALGVRRRRDGRRPPCHRDLHLAGHRHPAERGHLHLR